MRFLIVSDAPIIHKEGNYIAYAPYVKEMDLWMESVDRITFVCPTLYKRKLLTSTFIKQDITVRGLRRLEFHTLICIIISFITLPYQAIILWDQMRRADHIHLRAPGNLTLLACFVQVLFPKKKKTAKYAGNWDPKAQQPLSYKMQKWLLSNTLLTKNIQVLVYGKWEGMTKNIKPFFTASYFDDEKEDILHTNFKQPLRALFVGTMGANKRPLETVQMIHALRKEGVDISLEMFGEGEGREDVKWYIKENGLLDHIVLRGNQPAAVVKEAYKKAHFVILLSNSEGWPKVVAEAMFWGAIPIASKVSCVPWMLGDGDRGILIDDVSTIDITAIKKTLENTATLKYMSEEGVKWSRRYTMNTFATEIEKLLT